MHGFLCFGVGLLLAGCGSAQVATTTAREAGGTVTGVAASCAVSSPAQQFAAARLVFVGVMLPGRVIGAGNRRVLASPARVRVTRYLKGHGPRTVRVQTALSIDQGGGVTGNSEGIEPQVGEHWKIYTGSRRQPFDTSDCSGSVRVARGEAPAPGGHPAPAPTGSAALSLWSAFPVQANPRPIVPLGEGMVLAPRTGFHTGAAKIAYLEGRFALRAPLPPGAAAAYRRLRATGVNEHDKVSPLLVTAVKPGTAAFVTDRGRMRLATWQFYFKGVAEPASVLAPMAPELFVPPPLNRFGAPGPGNSIEDAATISASGKAITISFIGAHTGGGACDSAYRATAVSDSRAVAFAITAIQTPAQAAPGQICTAVGYKRLAVLRLPRPLGARVLVSATDGGAVAVTPAR